MLCSTNVGPYFTTYYDKVSFCMPLFSISKIIFHHSHVYNNKGGSVIGYYMIIGGDLMVQIGIMDNFKSQFLQWDDAAGSINYPGSFLVQTNLSSN